VSGPTGRVLALLEILQSGGVHAAPALARRLEVDERTVRRYVAHLVGLGVPVWPVHGRHGGYRLAPGYRLPPLMLTDEEAVAVLLGLVAAARTPLAATTAEAAESATEKVRRILPKPLADRVDAVLGAVKLTATRSAVPPNPRTLMLMAAAVRDHTPVEIAYTDRTGVESNRAIEPYGIVGHSGRWYVVAADTATREERTFRLDRIGRAAPRPGTFDAPTDLDPRQRLFDALATAPYRHDVSVIVEATLEELRDRLPASVAKLEPLAGGVRVRIRAQRLDWVPGLLAGLDRPFRIEQPDELRDLVRTVARRLGDAAR